MPDEQAKQTEQTPTKEQIIQAYQRLNNEVRQIQERVFDLQNKAEEHELVAKIIEPLPGDRKCCRLVSGVLVERTVAQVLPSVMANTEELHKACPILSTNAVRMYVHCALRFCLIHLLSVVPLILPKSGSYACFLQFVA